MLGVHEGRGAAVALRRGDDGQGQRGLARGLRPEDLDHATTRNSSHAQRNVEAQRARRDGFHLVDGARIAQAHDGAFAKLLFDLAQRGSESFLTILFHRESSTKCGSIISYPAPAAHLIYVELEEFFYAFSALSSSDQVSTTVYADRMPLVSEHMRQKSRTRQSNADIACSTGGCENLLARDKTGGGGLGSSPPPRARNSPG